MTIYLTQEYLKEILDYDLESGILVWKRREESNRHDKMWNTTNAGKRAGELKIIGYRYIGINRNRYLEHRIIWLWMIGVLPTYEIDHINGIRDDNRWKNLREANSGEQKQNKSKQSNNTSGYTGVYFNKAVKKYHAKINVKRKQISLGYFDNIEDANQCYIDAKRKYHTFQPTIRS